MLFGIGVLCHILYCIVCCSQNKYKLTQINYLGEERAVLSAIDYSYPLLFVFEGVSSSSGCLGNAELCVLTLSGLSI